MWNLINMDSMGVLRQACCKRHDGSSLATLLRGHLVPLKLWKFQFTVICCERMAWGISLLGISQYVPEWIYVPNSLKQATLLIPSNLSHQIGYIPFEIRNGTYSIVPLSWLLSNWIDSHIPWIFYKHLKITAYLTFHTSQSYVRGNTSILL
jgi:hypothetical protein